MEPINKSKKEKRILDVTEGPMIRKMILFAIPIMFSGILQQTFNTADTIVVGRWAGSEALGGVSATAPLIYLSVGLFSGLSIGATVAISQALGAKDSKRASLYAHNAIASALLCGVIMAVLGIFLARPVLDLMGTPDENIEYSVKYMQIYFGGAPFMLLYNYGSAVMRSVGETRRPLWYLTAGGCINVVLNLVLVIGFHMDSDGVAIATVVSNMISAVLVLHALCKSEHCCKIYLKRIRLTWDEFKNIMYIGVPAGIQGSVFALSNVVVQSSINQFGSVAVAANGASESVENYTGFCVDALSQAAMTFVGQNMGARKYKRVRNVFLEANFMGALTSLLLSAAVILFREPILSLYLPDDPAAVAMGCERILWVLPLWFTGAIMIITGSCIRGMGKSVMAMMITLIGICVFRIIWIATVFSHVRTLETIYLVFPLSWALTALIQCIVFGAVYRKLLKRSRQAA